MFAAAKARECHGEVRVVAPRRRDRLSAQIRIPINNDVRMLAALTRRAGNGHPHVSCGNKAGGITLKIRSSSYPIGSNPDQICRKCDKLRSNSTALDRSRSNCGRDQDHIGRNRATPGRNWQKLGDVALQGSGEEPRECARQVGEVFAAPKAALGRENMVLNDRKQKLLGLTKAMHKAREGMGGRGGGGGSNGNRQRPGV